MGSGSIGGLHLKEQTTDHILVESPTYCDPNRQEDLQDPDNDTITRQRDIWSLSVHKVNPVKMSNFWGGKKIDHQLCNQLKISSKRRLILKTVQAK